MSVRVRGKNSTTVYYTLTLKKKKCTDMGCEHQIHLQITSKLNK